MFEGQTTEINADMAAIARKLQELESGTPDRLLERFRRSQPMHPYLVAKTGGMIAAVGFMGLAALAMAAPFFGFGREAVILNLMLGTPAPLLFVVLSMTSGTLSMVSRVIALQHAATAPLLPHEQKQKQHLISDLSQLRTKMSLRQRAE